MNKRSDAAEAQTQGPNRRSFLKGAVAAIFAGPILSRLTGCASAGSAGSVRGRFSKSIIGMESAVADGAAMPFKIGAAEADITPTWPVMMAGFSSRKKPSEGYFDNLFVRAMTIDDGKNKVVYVMGDIASWDRRNDPRPPQPAGPNANPNAGSRQPSEPLNIIKTITAQIKESEGIDPEQIIFVSSHTHSGPVLHDARFKPMLIEKTVRCVREALGNARAARLFFGRGTTSAGISRRGRDIKGEDHWEINPYAQHDREVVVLKAVDRAGKPIALVFNYGCHPSMMGTQMLGADFVGYTAREMKKRLGGATALFLQGSGGDSKPNNPFPGKPFLFLPNAQSTPELTRAIGVQLADDISEVLEGNMEEITGAIRCATREVKLPVLSAWKGSGQRWIDAGSAPNPDDPFSGPRRRMIRYAKWMLESVDENGNYMQMQPADIYCVRIGDKFIHVGMSGEICAPIGLRVKDQLRGCNVMFTGYTGPMHGYVPGQAQITAGGYEAFTNPHHKPYSLEAEDMLVCDAMELVEAIGPKVPDLNPPQ